jgi:hypothetical protein
LIFKIGDYYLATKTTNMNFTIDESKPFDVTIREVLSSLENTENPTADDLVRILKGYQPMTSVRNDDSPEFKSLRNTLEAKGYIECQRSWWNGDRVLKSFTLNGIKFEVGNKFFSGAAMRNHLEWERKYENKRTNHY